MEKNKNTKQILRDPPGEKKKFFWVLLVFVLIIGIWIGVQGANQGVLTLATSAQGLTDQDGNIKVRVRAIDAANVNETLYTIDQTATVSDGQLKLRWQIPGTAKKKAAYIEVCALDKKAGPSSTVKKACIEEAGDVAYNKVSCPYYVPANSTGFSGQLNGWNKLDDSQKVGCSDDRSFGKVSSLGTLASAQSPSIQVDGGGVLVAENGKIEAKDVEQFVKDALSGAGGTVVQVTGDPTPGPQGVAGANGINGTNGVDGADGAVGVATVSGGGLILTGQNLSLDDSCLGGQILQWDGSNWGCASVAGTDSQTLSLVANVLAISGGNSVNLSGYLDNTDSQALSWNGGTRTLSLTSGGSVVISDSDTTYSAGNGLSLGGTTFSINSPTCAGTTKLTWNGTAFSCAADVDTDTDTTNFNVAANGGAGQNISAGGTVNFTNGTGTTASRSGSDISFGLANTAVTSGTYSASNNANGSLALPQFTVDAQGRLTAASTSNVTLTGIANSQLANSAITVNTAGPLAGGGSVSLGGSLNLSLDLSDAGDSATATTSSGSGLEISGNEVGLLRGCSSNQLLKWNSGSLRWECATDTDTDTNSGGTVTGITAGTGLTGGTITTSGTINIATTGVTAATYGSSTSIPVITVNAQGQITAASSSAIPTATTSTTGLLTDTDWDTFNGKENVLTFTGNGLFSRSGNTVTGLACSAGQIPKWTAGTFACGADDNSGTTYSAGNGLSLGGTTFSINSPTCAGTDKLTWSGTAFSCASDVDTDTDTTNFNVAAAGTVGSQNITSGGTVTFGNGTGTTATRSGSTVTYGLNNTAVSAGTYSPSDNANGSLALPQFTVDAQGRLTAASTTNVTLTGIANSQLANSAITVNTAGGLTGGSSVSLGGSINLSLDLSDAGDAATASTNSGSGLEVSGGEIGLIRGCNNTQLLKWNSSSLRWECASDVDTNSGGTVTSVTAGTGLSGGTITSTGTIDIANTGVTAASYGSSTSIPVITVNAQGQITAASSSAIPTATTSTTGLLTDTDWDTFNGKENVLTFNGNGLFSRSGNTVTGLACIAGEIPKWTAGAFACGADAGGASYSAGNGLSLGGSTFSINSPTCSGTDKLQWTGTAFTCSADVDTGVTSVGTIDSQTKSANGAVISGTSLVLQTADGSNPGLVSTGTQTFAGAKTFSGSVNANGDVTLGDAAADGITITGEIRGASPLAFEGATNDGVYTTFAITDPTLARTITFPDASGTVCLQGSASCGFISVTLSDGQILIGNGSSVATAVTPSGDVTISNTGVTTIGANSVALGTDTTGNYVAGNTAGNGISVSGSTGEGWSPTISINAPTCAGTDKLTWNGSAFSCAADVDTDTDTTNFNVAAQGTVGSQNIASGDTVTFNNGTGTTATRSGSTVTYGLNNTAVSAGTYSPSDNANGSLALPQFTVDAQGRLTAASTTNVTLTGIANSQLTNSAITVNTAGGLTGGSSVSLGGSINLSLDLSDSGDTATATTNSGSGLEVSGGEIGLIRGCSSNQLLKWNSTSLRWECASDVDTDTDTGVTSVGTIDSQTKSANGAVISGTVVYLQTADASNPGLVSTGTQTFAGNKTFNGNVIADANLNVNGDVTLGNAATDGITFTGEIRGASPLAFEGATNDGVYTTFAITDPTVARTITFPDASGTVCLQASSSCGFISTTLSDGQILIGNGSNVATAVTPSGDVTISNTGVTTIGANSVALGTDTTGNYVAGNTAGNGISVSGSAGEGWSPTISINAPTCAGTDKLTWNGSAFSCASDLDTDTTNFNVAAQGTVGSQNIASGDTVTFNNGTGTTATRSGSTVTYSLNNTAVSAGTYAPSDNANGSLAIPQFTVDAQGRLTAASTTNVTLTGIANSQLTNSSITVNTAGGLSGGASVSLGGTLNLSLDLSDAGDSTTATTNSGSGLEVSGGEIGLLRGCSNNQLLKWDSTNLRWACASDVDTDTGVTSVGTIDSQTKSANGAVISGSVIYLQTADASNPGLVSTGTQTFAGDKTFSGDVAINGGDLTTSSTTFNLLNTTADIINLGGASSEINLQGGAGGGGCSSYATGYFACDDGINASYFEAQTGLFLSNVPNATNEIAFTLNSVSNLTASGVKLLSVQNWGSEVFSIDKFGNVIVSANLNVDGATTLGNAATDAITFTGEVRGASPLAFEGATNDGVYTTFAITDPTVARTITFPDRSGTVSLSGDTFTGDVTGTLNSSGATALTIAANSVALGTDTTGDYVSGNTAGNGISVSGSAGEGWSPTISINAPTCAGTDKLQWNGSAFVCSTDIDTDTGVTSIGTIDSQTKSANGAVITGSSLVLQTADATMPGLVSTGTQTFAGAKTFTGNLTATGTATFQNAVDSGNAFSILDSTGTAQLFNVDTVNKTVTLNTDGYFNVYTSTGNNLYFDPTAFTVSGANGGINYSDTTGTFSAYGLTSSLVFDGANGVLQMTGSAAGDGLIFDGATNRLSVGTNPGSSYTLNVDGSVNITSGNAYRINGTDINTAGTLSNVAYKNAANTFTLNNTFSTSITTPLVTSSGALAVTGGSTLTLSSTGANAVSLDSGTTGAINIGTGANAKTITIGNATGASATVVNCGTGNCQFAANATDHATTIGSTTGVSNTNIRSGTGGISLIASGSGSTGIVRIGNGTPSTTPDILALDVKTDSGDPTGSDGYMYYNSNSGKFRCYQNSAWADCITVDTDTDTTYSAGNGLSLGGTTFSINSPTCSGTDKLQWTGTAFQCAADVDTGITSIGTIDSQTKSANGAVISGNTLVLQTADATMPGLVSTGTQTFAGDKTFTGLVTANGGLTIEAGDTFTMNGDAFTDLTGSGLTISGGALTVDASTATGFFRNGGNTFGAAATLGTNDVNVLNFETNNTNRFQISSNSSKLTGQGTTEIDSTGALFIGGNGSNGIAIGNNSVSANQIVIGGSVNVDYVNLQSTTGITITSNDTTVVSQNDSATAFQIQNSLASPLFNVDASTASTIVYSPYDSASAFQVQDSASRALLNVDAATGSTTIASGGSTTALQVLNGSGDQLMNVDTTNIINNLIANPSFEVDDTGWAYIPGYVDTTQAYVGKSSLRVDTTTAGDGAMYDVASLASDTSYTLSFYAKAGSGNYEDFTSLYAGYYDGTSDTDCLTSQTVSSSGWTRYSCTFTTGTTSGVPNIYMRQNDSTDRAFYIDGVQLIENTLPSSIITGTNSTFESGIGSWSGYSGSSPTQSSAQAHMGTYSGRMITSGGGNENGVSLGVSGLVSASTTYTIKAYIKADASSTPSTYQLGHTLDNGQVLTSRNGCNIVTPTSSTWKVLTCTFTTASSLRGAPYITLTQTNNLSTATTTYIDSVSMYAGTDAYGTDQGFTMGRISLNGAIESPTLFQNASNSTTAFQIQGANSSNALLVADTLNNRIGIGKNTAAYTLDVEGIINASSSVITPSLTSLAGTALSIDSGTTGAINIGTGANAKTITIGNATGATSTVVNCGTGACSFGANATAHTTTLGSATGAANTIVQAGTGGLTLGSSGVANTIQIGNTTGAVSQTINIGTNATASSTNNVNIGSTVAGTTAIAGPTTITGRTSGSSSTLVVNNSTSTGAIFTAQDNGTAVLTIANNGGATFKTVTNTSNAFKTTNSNNDVLLNVGTAQSISDYTNIINNSSFESGSTGWTGKNGGSMGSGSGGGSVTGIGYMSIGMNAIDEGTYYSVTLSPNTDYTFSVYARTYWGAMNTLVMGHQDQSGTDIDDCVLTSETIDTDWHRVSCTFTTGSTISSSNVYIKQSDATNRSVEFDAVQLQAQASLGAYNMGEVYFNAPINQNLIVTANGYSGINDLTFQVQDSTGALQFGVSAGGQVTVTNGLAVNGGDLTSTATTFNFLQSNVTELNIGAAVGSSGINLAGGSGSTGCTINGAVGSLTCSGSITSTATSGILGWWTRSGTTLQPGNSGDNITTSGNISTTGSGNITSAGGLQVDGNTTLGDAATDTILAKGSMIANATATGTTDTTSGTGTNTTTVTISGTSFANGDVILIDNAGQDYYTRVVSGGGTSTLTVSPAVTFETGRTVTKYTVQNIGATDSNYTTASNRFFQGYFLGGVVTGAGSTTLSDGRLHSTVGLNFDAPSYTFTNTSDSTSAFRVDKADGSNLVKFDTATTENLLSNGNFEANTTGWAAHGSSTVSQTGSQYYLGTGSMSVVTTAAANDGAKYNYSLASQTSYTLTFYAKMSVTTGSYSTINIGRSEDGSTDSDCATSQTVYGSGWNKITCSFTTANVSGTPYIYIKQTDAVAKTLYIDSVQLQSTSAFNSNTDFESGNTGWGQYNVGSLTNSSAQAYTGSNSLQVETDPDAGTQDGAVINTGTVLPNTTYRASFMVRLDGTTAASKSFSLVKRFDTADGTTSTCTSATLTADTWTNITCTFTTGNVIAASPFIGITTLGASDSVTIYRFWIDNAVVAPVKWTSNDVGRISLNGSIDSPLTVRGAQDSLSAFQVQQQNGKSLLVVDTLNGRVGINTETPTKELEVSGKALIKANSSDTDTFRVEGSATSNNIAFNVAGNTRAVTVGASSNTSSASLSVYGTQLINTKSNSASAFRITDASGITALSFATTSGNRKLAIGGTGTGNDGGFLIANSGGNVVSEILSTGNGLAYFSVDDFQVNSYTSGNPIITADGTTGNVGIGQYGGAYPLDVIGDINSSTGYRIAGTAGASTTCSGGQFLQNQVVVGGLTTGGTCAAAGSGVTTVGAFSGSSQTNGASISGSTITFGPADGTNPGMVTTGTQTFAGNKTFNGDVEIFGSSINLGNNAADTITATANLRASNSATATTDTTNGTGTNTTTLTITGTAFANNDVILIDNAGQDYYTRVVSGGGTSTLTVSPAITFENARTVTKYNVQNIGATPTDYTTTSNRFFQGYFLGGVVTGAGTTSLSDGLLYSSGPLNINASAINFNANIDMTNNLLTNIGDAGTDFTSGGGLTLAGTLVANGAITLAGTPTITNGLVQSGVADGASSVGFNFNTPSYTTAGANLLVVANNGTGKFAIDKDGNVTIASGAVYKSGIYSGITGGCTSGQFVSDINVVGGLFISGTCLNAVTTIGSIGGSIANGGSISGNTLTFGTADASNPGMVSTGTQTFAGDKTLTGLTTLSNTTASGTVMTLTADSLTSGNGLTIGSTATGLTGNLFSVTSASTGAFSNGGIRYNFTGAHTGNGVQIDDATTTGTVYQINANALTTGTAFEITGPSAAKMLRVKNDSTQSFNKAQLIIGEGDVNNPDSLARDQLYVFGRINTSWNQLWTDCLTSEGTKSAATTATGVYGAAYSGSATTGRLAQGTTSGVSGVCRFTQATPAANATTYFGSGGASTTERSLNPVFEARVLSDTNTDHRNLIGFTDMAASTAITADTNNSANEAFFRKNAAGTQWETVTRSASGTEEINTNVGSTNAWHRLRIEMDNGNAAIRFYVDGTLVATHTTAVPTAQMGFTVANNVTSTSSRTLDVDYMRVWSDDPPESVAPGSITQDEGLDTTANTPVPQEPEAEDNSNDALLARIKDLETDVADLKQYKDVLTTEMLGDASSKKAVFISDVEFRNQVEFSADALFKANVNVDGTLNANGRVVVSNNTGTVTVQPGQTEIQVLFTRPLITKPNVFVSTENPDIRVVAQGRTANGFIIKLSEPITTPLDVQWFAVEKE